MKGGRAAAQMALLLDGPSQFFATPPLLPLGDTLLQWRLLLTAHWNVSPGVAPPFHLSRLAPQCIGWGVLGLSGRQELLYLKHAAAPLTV